VAPTNFTSWKEDETQLKIAYYGARSIWGKRFERVPNGKETWDEWFKRRYAMNLYDFSIWANENNLGERFKK
jgi:hypothetical protein